MINFKVGNIFNSKAEAIINTVNCEGKMGKGLAFQFKKKYPVMEKSYVETCKNGLLSPGKLHIFFENDKYIINFPTKNKWRENSKLIYITDGLKELKKELISRNISSVAIPPLGSGNGGLDWNKVKLEIIRELEDISENIYVEVYEPSDNVSSKLPEPKVDYKTLFLLRLSLEIKDFRVINLTNAVQLAQILSNNQILIPDLTKETEKILALKNYYSVDDNNQLLNLVKNKLISNSIEKNEDQNKELIEKVGYLVNEYDTDLVKNMIVDLNSKERSRIDKPEIKDILLNEGIVTYNLFNEREINYLVKKKSLD